MNRVIEGLRQSPKGQLRYDRDINGQSLTDLLRKCSSAPALSSPHSEKSPPHLKRNVSFGLAPVEDGEGDELASSAQNDSSKVLQDHSYEEKGERDSVEQECSPAVLHKWTSFADSLQKKSQAESVTPGKSGGVKSSVFHSGSVLSPVEQVIDRTADISTNLNKSGDGDHASPDPVPADLTVSFTEKLRLISDIENDWDNKVKARLEQKHQEFLRHQREVERLQERGMSEAEQQHLRDMQQQQELVEKTQISRKQEIQQAVQKVKESHEHCVQRQAARLKELERLGQQLKEEQVKKEQALEQRLNELRTMAQSIASTKATLMQTLDSCPHKQYLSEAAEKTRMLVRKLAEQAEALVGSADRSGPLDEIMAKLKQFQQQSQNALDFVNSLTAEAAKKAEEERKKQQAPPPQQPQGVPGQAPTQGGPPAYAQAAAAAGEEGALAAVAKVYADNVKLLSQTEAALQPFVGDQQMKKVRFDLQRAVNTPVNAISAVNSAHLRDKLMRLRSLLKGEVVEVVGKRVSAQAVPQGITFCKNLVAKMIARKADEQVSSSHESAFGVAAVAVGLWCEFPDVGELLMAHLQALCPYVVPFYPPRLPNQSTTDYHKTLGYKVDEDGMIEQQDKFLRRMSGLMRLYAAIMVTSPPQGAHLPHPHGLEHAWIWLTRTLNLQPNPDITATAVYDMLQVTGHFLLKAYKIQFVKLVYCLYKVFLPKLKAVAAGSGPVSRLETFLENTMKNNAFIPEPEGYINSRFWNF